MSLKGLYHPSSKRAEEINPYQKLIMRLRSYMQFSHKKDKKGKIIIISIWGKSMIKLYTKQEF